LGSEVKGGEIRKQKTKNEAERGMQGTESGDGLAPKKRETLKKSDCNAKKAVQGKGEQEEILNSCADKVRLGTSASCGGWENRLGAEVSPTSIYRGSVLPRGGGGSRKSPERGERGSYGKIKTEKKKVMQKIWSRSPDG